MKIRIGAMEMKRKGQIPDSAGSEEQNLTSDEMEGAKERLRQRLFWELIWEETGVTDQRRDDNKHITLFFVLDFIYLLLLDFIYL